VIGPFGEDNTQHSQDTDILTPAGFEPTIPASEQPQTHALDRAVTGFGGYPLSDIDKDIV
jgi:hypothetical protein